jgi:acetyltransferase-like isoleucine patch superfamily enzyme
MNDVNVKRNNKETEVNQYLGGQKDLLDKNKGTVRKYKDFFLGKVSFFYFLKYELIMLVFSRVPGALGFALRKLFFPSLFKKVGKGVVFGRNMTIRHPKKIEIGDKVVFDDNTVIDAKGENNSGLIIGNNVLIGRNTIISCKGGDIQIGDYSNIGPNNVIISESVFKIGQYVFTAGNVYMIAGGNHTFDRRDIPIWLQPCISKGGIILDDDIWIGAASTVLDGVRIGRGAVIGAASLVHKRIRPFTVNVGVPAQMVKRRE